MWRESGTQTDEREGGGLGMKTFTSDSKRTIPLLQSDT